MECNNSITTQANKVDYLDRVLSITTNLFLVAAVYLPEFAQAQSLSGASGAFGGITAFLKSIAQLLIYEWGYYIGIITLAIQGYRWKTGRIDLLALGGWGFAICLVFFSPSIVADIKSRSSGTIQ